MLNLHNECLDLTIDVQAYFNYDLHLSSLMEPLFNMRIVQRLIVECKPGEWCLNDELDVLKNMQDDFYYGKLCEDEIWECFFNVLLRRKVCNEKVRQIFN